MTCVEKERKQKKNKNSKKKKKERGSGTQNRQAVCLGDATKSAILALEGSSYPCSTGATQACTFSLFSFPMNSSFMSYVLMFYLAAVMSPSCLCFRMCISRTGEKWWAGLLFMGGPSCINRCRIKMMFFDGDGDGDVMIHKTIKES